MSNEEKLCRITDYTLGGHMENFNVETSALHRKLQSKADALRILRQEVECFRTERDQFKLMAETLQLRYSAMKRSSELCYNGGGSKSSVASLLHDTRERNLMLTTEMESLKQKLGEIQGDIEILRETTHIKNERKSDGKIYERRSSENMENWKEDRANLIENMESLKRQNTHLSADLKAVIDEKEELVVERDAYKCKAHRLNHELFSALKANQKNAKLIDVDSIVMENKYLNERLKNCELEMSLMKRNLSKYKCMLESKSKKGIMKLGSDSNNDNILSPKQVQSLLENGFELPPKIETMQDLKSLCHSLLDNLNDKNLALTHQKKTNKVLGLKIGELEQRIQSMAGIDDTAETGYSPAELLLNGYCPIFVDPSDSNATVQTLDSSEDVRKSSGDSDRRSTEDSSRRNTEDLGRQTTEDSERDEEKQTPASPSDDGMSTYSTESARSVLSSEYSGIINGVAHKEYRYSNSFANNTTFPYNTLTMDNKTETDRICECTSMGSLVPFNIEQERINDLKDLPPELAAIVQDALRDLDKLDLEKKKVDIYQKPQCNCNCNAHKQIVRSLDDYNCKKAKLSKGKTVPGNNCICCDEALKSSALHYNDGEVKKLIKNQTNNKPVKDDFDSGAGRESKLTGSDKKSQRDNLLDGNGCDCSEELEVMHLSLEKFHDCLEKTQILQTDGSFNEERKLKRLILSDDDDCKYNEKRNSKLFTLTEDDDYNFSGGKKSHTSALLSDNDCNFERLEPRRFSLPKNHDSYGDAQEAHGNTLPVRNDSTIFGEIPHLSINDNDKFGGERKPQDTTSSREDDFFLYDERKSRRNSLANDNFSSICNKRKSQSIVLSKDNEPSFAVERRSQCSSDDSKFDSEKSQRNQGTLKKDSKSNIFKPETKDNIPMKKE